MNGFTYKYMKYGTYLIRRLRSGNALGSWFVYDRRKQEWFGIGEEQAKNLCNDNLIEITEDEAFLELI